MTDSTGAVLPASRYGNQRATGNAFEAVTDDRGTYRLPVRIGVLRITAVLQGFNSPTRSVELLVGQTGVVNLQMSPTGVAESITVTGEAPLIEITTSSLGGNVDPRQVEELPQNGRNWIGLAMLAPGARTVPVAGTRENSEKPLPDRNNNETREFHLNVDGQQVTSELGRAVSRDTARIRSRSSSTSRTVRRDAGPVGGRTGQRDQQVGHESVLGCVSDQFSK